MSKALRGSCYSLTDDFGEAVRVLTEVTAAGSMPGSASDVVIRDECTVYANLFLVTDKGSI